MNIIKVEPTNPMISLSWMIGARCNYACSYCPSELHDDYSAHPDLDKLKQSWNSFYSKTRHLALPYKVSFTGGEVTANRSFLPLIEYLKTGDFNIGQILVTTNGSASKAYYLKLAQYVDSISFSTHTDFWNEQKFFDTVIAVNQVMIRPKKSIHVNIMDEPNARHRFPEFEKILDQNSVSYSINKINYARSS
jgi:molybdenum cofactor biosynthesis enzyme MoaA